MTTFTVLSPGTGKPLLERPWATPKDIQAALSLAEAQKHAWRRTPLAERSRWVAAFVDAVVESKDAAGKELTEQMGRPIRYSAGEIGGFEERARAMIAMAEDALGAIRPPEKEGFERFVSREPLGLVLALAPWNYPWLTAVNVIVPALLAGNVVLLKHSDQTPLVAERLFAAAEKAGLPKGVFQYVHASHPDVARMAQDSRIDYVAFTGSVAGGRAVKGAIGDRFIAMGLELGGKDAAYVAPDADFDFSVENLVDGAFFNSGQSCCGIERIYVHESIYPRFVDAFVEKVHEYSLGDPLLESTTLGPVVRRANKERIAAQIEAAVKSGARALVDQSRFEVPASSAYMAPEVLVDVTHDMDAMREETFGPLACIAPVSSDEEAIEKINDSRYGLTSGIWTSDIERARTMAKELETGTVFMNRCDYLDPELAWVGVKDSGRGCTLSKVGFESLTRPKSHHFRIR